MLATVRNGKKKKLTELIGFHIQVTRGARELSQFTVRFVHRSQRLGILEDTSVLCFPLAVALSNLKIYPQNTFTVCEQRQVVTG